MASDAPLVDLPRGTLPAGRPSSTTPEGAVAWTQFGAGSVRVVVFLRRLDGGGVLAFARDNPSIFAEAPTAEAAIAELREVARAVQELYRDSGASIPVEVVEREPGDELVGSFVIDA